MKRAASLLLLLLLATHCQTAAMDDETAPSPKTEQTVKNVDERLQGAVARDSPVELRQVAKSLASRQESAAAATLLLADWIDPHSPISDKQQQTAIALYLMLPEAKPPRLFAALVRSHELASRRMAWQVATTYPSDLMANAVSLELSHRAAHGKGTKVGLSPEAALAAKANHLKAAYPLLRTSLMAAGDIAYARAMIALGGDGVADDLLTYLALATPQEITSGRLRKVHRATVELALDSFASTPSSLHHPNFKHLFYYAASKDQGLSRQATHLLTNYVAQKEEHFAFLLAQVPVPVQEAFLTKLHQSDPQLHKSFVDLLRALSPPAGH